MVVDGTWVYRCPICGKALQHIEPGSVIYNTPIYCRRCKVSHYPTILRGGSWIQTSPSPSHMYRRRNDNENENLHRHENY